jgi:hypothetical protein
MAISFVEQVMADNQRRVSRHVPRGGVCATEWKQVTMFRATRRINYGRIPVSALPFTDFTIVIYLYFSVSQASLVEFFVMVGLNVKISNLHIALNKACQQVEVLRQAAVGLVWMDGAKVL